MRIFERLVPQSLSGRVFAVFAATLLAFLGTGVGIFYQHEFTSGINEAHEAAQNLTEILTPTVSDSVVIGDYDTVRRTLTIALRNSPFESASFIDMRGATINVLRRGQPASGVPSWLREYVEQRLPPVNRVITVGGRDYGVLRLRFAPEIVAAQFWDITAFALALAVAAAVIGLALIRWSLRRWLDPLVLFRDVGWEDSPAGSLDQAMSDAPREVRDALRAFARAGAALQVQRLTAAATMDAVGDGVITADPNGRIIYANPAASHFLKAPGDALTGQNVMQLLPALAEAQGRANETSAWKARRIDFAADGNNPLFVDITYSPIPDASGTVIGHVVTIRDVSEAHAYEARLTEELETRRAAILTLYDALTGMLPDANLEHVRGSETDLRYVSRLVADLVREREASHRALDNQMLALNQHAAVSIADATGKIIYANEKFSELSGYAVEELVGSNHRVTSSGLHPLAFYDEMWDTITDGHTWHGEVVNRNRSGALYWAATTIVPWLDAEGRPAQYIAIRTDISAQKRVERELAEASRRELALGQEIQRSLLIGDLPTGIRGALLASYAEPSQGIDGDFYGFTTYRPDCFELLVGDVMGKGVPAALVGAALRTTYNQVVTELMAASVAGGVLPRPAEIVNALHRRLTPRLIELETFATLALYRFDLSAGRLTYVNAGHTPGILDSSSGMVETFLGENLPVGVMPDERYLESARSIKAGDALVVYSDGITEARDAEGRQFGDGGLHAAVAATHGKDVPPAIRLQAHRKRLRDFVGSHALSDDQTMVIVEVCADAGDEEHFELPWTLAGLGILRERIFRAAASAGLKEERVSGLVLAAFEAATNVVRHVTAPFPDATLGFRLRPEADGLTVELWYVGLPFSPDLELAPDFSGESEGGFGLYIIEQMVSHVSYESPALDICCTRLTQRPEVTAAA